MFREGIDVGVSEFFARFQVWGTLQDGNHFVLQFVARVFAAYRYGPGNLVRYLLPRNENSFDVTIRAVAVLRCGYYFFVVAMFITKRSVAKITTMRFWLYHDGVLRNVILLC